MTDRSTDRHQLFLATQPNMQPELREVWRRQQRSAQAIEDRFKKDFDTVLLADEVGMGKTYVALAAMAQHLSEGENRRVLLITPPSSVLRDKWQQEIHAFSHQYLLPQHRQLMRPVVVNGYGELLRGLHRYADQKVERVDKEPRLRFTWCLFEWAYSRDLLGKKRRVLWKSIAHLYRDHPEMVIFLSNYSEQALRGYLDDDYARRKDFYRALFLSLQNSGEQGLSVADAAALVNVFKPFANAQSRYVPNVFVVGMNALSRPRVDHHDNQQLSKFLLALLLKRRQLDTRKDCAKCLVQARVLPDEFADRHSHRWRLYDDSLKALVDVDFYGLREAANGVLNSACWADKFWKVYRDPTEAQKFFNRLGNAVFEQQLKQSGIDLAVVDEVHNWKGGAYGAEAFRDFYAPDIRHKLLMSATPFQMEEGELPRVFGYAHRDGGKSAQVMAELKPSDSQMARCLKASQAFAEAWKKLSALPGQAAQMEQWFDADNPDAVEAIARQLSSESTVGHELRDWAHKLVVYRQAVVALQTQLRQVVIRHTKGREKRSFHIGVDFDQPDAAHPRRLLYPTPGYGSQGCHALVNFVGMRLGQLVRRENDKTMEANARLLGGLTSSKAAFQEGAKRQRLGKTPATAAYRAMFDSLLEQQPHPKVATTVERAFANYQAGRKTLIFCERVATLGELNLLLQEKIAAFIQHHGGSSAMARRDVIRHRGWVENLWWHSLWAAVGQVATGPDELLEAYLPEAQRLAQDWLVKKDLPPSERRIIQLLDIFLLARVAQEKKIPSAFQAGMAVAALFERMASDDAALEAWLTPGISGQPGQAQAANEPIAADDSAATQDAAEAKAEKKLVNEEAIARAVETVAEQQYLKRRNLWIEADSSHGSLQPFHAALWRLLAAEAKQLQQMPHAASVDGAPDASVHVFFDLLDDLMAGIRKIMLSDDLLARYAAAGHEDGQRDAWQRIADGMRNMPIGHDRSMLHRVVRFLEELAQADGTINRASQTPSKRRGLWRGVFVRELDSVATLDGSTPAMRRVDLCAGFNSPLLPDILICTSIGSEGIDLHRQCADVIHHDLPWNPAKLEQRNGRVDRVGSLAAVSNELPIHIGIPFLANDYEDYQYQKVLSRAQKFEVLLGKPEYDAGDLDEVACDDQGDEETVREADADATLGEDAILCPLPPSVVDALQLDLTVPV